MVWKFRPKFRPNSDQIQTIQTSQNPINMGFCRKWSENSDQNSDQIQTKIQTMVWKFRPKFRPNSDQIQTKFRPKFRPWPDSCQCEELVLIVCWAHQVFQEWQAQRPKGFGQHGKTQPFYLTLVTQGKGHFRLLRAMQLKIAQKILNLSFKDKSWLKLKISPQNPQYFWKSSNFFLSKNFEDPQIFWGFGPSKYFEEKTSDIKYWGLGLQGRDLRY